MRGRWTLALLGVLLFLAGCVVVPAPFWHGSRHGHGHGHPQHHRGYGR